MFVDVCGEVYGEDVSAVEFREVFGFGMEFGLEGSCGVWRESGESLGECGIFLREEMRDGADACGFDVGMVSG